MPRKAVTLRRWQIATAFLLITAAFVVASGLATRAASDAHRAARDARALGIQNARRIEENRHLLYQIQVSRLESCRRTYQAFIDLFKPFIPPNGTAQANRFFRLVRQRKASCGNQTKPK